MKALAAFAVLLLLSACQLLDRVMPESQGRSAAPVPAPQRVSTPPSAAEELLAYLAHLRTMNEAALNTEATRQKQLGARSSDDLAKVKAALALFLAPQAEESDVVALVDPVARKDAGPAEVRAMASFLQVLANERRRLKESATAARNTLGSERRAVEAQKQRADALQERATQLQQKLDALTELEKSLSDRSPPSR